MDEYVSWLANGTYSEACAARIANSEVMRPFRKTGRVGRSIAVDSGCQVNLSSIFFRGFILNLEYLERRQKLPEFHIFTLVKGPKLTTFSRLPVLAIGQVVLMACMAAPRSSRSPSIMQSSSSKSTT